MSFFYEGRLPVYVWGSSDFNSDGSLFPKYTSQSYVFLADQYANSIYDTRYPRVPIAEDGPRILEYKWAPGTNLTAHEIRQEEDSPCDQQFPWKKLHSTANDSADAMVGLTIHGEMYMCLGNSAYSFLDNVLSGGWYSEGGDAVIGNMKSTFSQRRYSAFRESRLPSELGSDGSVPRFRRLAFAGVDEAIKDFSIAGSLVLTLISKSGRVFVCGFQKSGAHGVSPYTTRDDASLVSLYGEQEFFSQDPELSFYLPKQPSRLPIVTEVILPGGVKAASVPACSSNCVIGDDAQLYYWWWEKSKNEMHPPKKFTGFVKFIEVKEAGSGYYLKGQNGLPDLSTFQWSVEFQEPSGGRAASAVCQFIDGKAAYVCVVDGGEGYGNSPPSWKFQYQDAPTTYTDIHGSGVELTFSVFGENDGFRATDAAGRGFLLSETGELYLLGFVDTVSQYGPVPERFTSPVKYHSKGPYKFARGSSGLAYSNQGLGACVIGEDGKLYLMSHSGIRGADGAISQTTVDRVVIEVDAEGEVQSPNFKRLGSRSPTGAGEINDVAVYESNVLLPAGDGFVCADCTDVLAYAPQLRGAVAILAIRENGTLCSGGGNAYGALGDGSSEETTRRSLVDIATKAKWLNVFCFVESVYVFAAIRKDAICRSLDQPMEYYPDDYYKTLQ